MGCYFEFEVTMGRRLECEVTMGRRFECEVTMGRHFECEVTMGRHFECEVTMGRHIECEVTLFSVTIRRRVRVYDASSPAPVSYGSCAAVASLGSSLYCCDTLPLGCFNFSILQASISFHDYKYGIMFIFPH